MDTQINVIIDDDLDAVSAVGHPQLSSTNHRPQPIPKNPARRVDSNIRRRPSSDCVRGTGPG
jgi:hypothetical protein